MVLKDFDMSTKEISRNVFIQCFLKTKLEFSKKTMKELSLSCDLTPATIRKVIEGGDVKLSVLLKICNVLDIALESLFVNKYAIINEHGFVLLASDTDSIFIPKTHKSFEDYLMINSTKYKIVG